MIYDKYYLGFKNFCYTSIEIISTNIFISLEPLIEYQWDSTVIFRREHQCHINGKIVNYFLNMSGPILDVGGMGAFF